MEIKEEINNIIQRILDSEDEWKALYMASWGAVFHWLERDYKNTPLWNQPQPLGLPASKKGYQMYTPAQLDGILRSKDSWFTLGHLQALFSLLEELVTELCPIVCNGQEIRADKFKNLKKFLLGENPYQNFQINITGDEIKELNLAKETRNCFIHKNSKVDEHWLEAFKGARGKDSIDKIGGKLPVGFREVEDWHELIIGIVKRIKDTITKS